MNEVQIKLTVLFDGTFWIGIIERVVDHKLEVSKITFGKEPKEIEIYDFLLHRYQYLSFCDPVDISTKHKKEIFQLEKMINPKRMQRLVKRKNIQTIGTRSKQALKLQHAQNKIRRKTISKQRKEEQSKLKFEIKRKKRIQKHKGR